jgi:hypothetical protein
MNKKAENWAGNALAIRNAKVTGSPEFARIRAAVIAAVLADLCGFGAEAVPQELIARGGLSAMIRAEIEKLTAGMEEDWGKLGKGNPFQDNLLGGIGELRYEIQTALSKKS